MWMKHRYCPERSKKLHKEVRLIFIEYFVGLFVSYFTFSLVELN